MQRCQVSFFSSHPAPYLCIIHCVSQLPKNLEENQINGQGYRSTYEEYRTKGDVAPKGRERYKD